MITVLEPNNQYKISSNDFQKGENFCYILNITNLNICIITTPDHVRRQHETAYQLVFKSRQFPGINIDNLTGPPPPLLPVPP